MCRRTPARLCAQRLDRVWLSTSRLTKPQNGPLAVAGGRQSSTNDQPPVISPFVLDVATKDFHPPAPDHISLAPNHEPRNNKPYEPFAIIINPFDSAETKQTRLWPVHCVQDTPGADIIPEIDTSRFDAIVRKGQDRRVEMYSGFVGAFGGRLGASFGSGGATQGKENQSCICGGAGRRLLRQGYGDGCAKGGL